MRFIAALACAILLALSAQAQITHIQNNVSAVGGSGTPLASYSLVGNAIAIGNTVCGIVRYYDASAHGSSIVSGVTVGSTAATIVDTVSDSGEATYWVIFCLNNIAGNPTTVTVSFSPAQGEYIGIVWDEFAGVSQAVSLPLDGHTGQFITNVASTANAVTSGAITPGTAGDLIYGSTGQTTGTATTLTAGSNVGYALVGAGIAGAGFLSTEWSVQGGAATTAGDFTSSTAALNWGVDVLALKPGAALTKQPSAVGWVPSTAPPGTTSTAAQVMAGISAGITPTQTGRLHIRITGDVSNATAVGDGGIFQIRYGSSATPQNAGAAAGSTAGAAVKYVVGTVARALPIMLDAIVTGLTTGTPYWIDVGQEATTGGTAAIEHVNVSAVEF